MECIVKQMNPNLYLVLPYNHTEMYYFKWFSVTFSVIML